MPLPPSTQLLTLHSDTILLQHRSPWQPPINVAGDPQSSHCCLKNCIGSFNPCASSKLSSSNYYSKNIKSSLIKAKKAKSKVDIKSDEAFAAVVDDSLSDLLNEEVCNRHLIEDDKDPSLDISPNGRTLFTSTTTISQLSIKDTCTYIKFKYFSMNLCVPLCVARLVL